MPHKSHRALRGHQREVLVRSCRMQAMVAARGFQLEMRRSLSGSAARRGADVAPSSGRSYSWCRGCGGARGHGGERKGYGGSKRRGCCASGVGVSVGVAVSVGSGVSVCVGRSKYALKYIFGVSFATPLAPH